MGLADQSQLRRFSVVFPAAVTVLYVWLLALTIPDYGVMWDVWELYVGDHYLYYFGSFDQRHLNFGADTIDIYHSAKHPDWHDVTTAYPDNDALEHPLLIWPLGATLAALSKQIFSIKLGLFAPIDGSHLMLLPFAAALLIAVWRYGYRQFGRWPAVVAILAVAVHPRLWAHMHNNIKDVPTAVFWTLTIVAFARGARSRSARWLLISAVFWGLGLATKANGVFLPAVLIPYFLAVLWRRRQQEQPLTHNREIIACVLYPVIGVGVMIALWPLLWQDFPARLIELVESLRVRGGHNATDAVNWWAPRQAFATMPIAMGVMMVAGILVSLWGMIRHAERRADYLLVLLWTTVPVARVFMPGTYDFDGIRHWLEFIPGAALLCGIGIGPLLQRLEDRLAPSPAPAADSADDAEADRIASDCHPTAAADAALDASDLPTVPDLPADDDEPDIALAEPPAEEDEEDAPTPILPVLLPLLLAVAIFTPALLWHYRHHPHAVVYYNAAVGGLSGARAKGYPDATDYWANAYRDGFDWLWAHAEPGSTLYLGVAEHVGFYTRGAWIRDDILLRNLIGREDMEVDREIRQAQAPVYLMYVTRENWYHQRVHDAIAVERPVVYQVDVDGGTVLVIRRLR